VAGCFLFVLSLLLSFDCTAQSDQYFQTTQGLEVKGCSWGSAYTVFINDEPVCETDGGETALYRGFPIHYGTNNLAVNVVFRPDFSHPLGFPPNVTMFLYTQESDGQSLNSLNWNALDVVQEDWTTGEPYLYKTEFVMSKKTAIQNFEEIGASNDSCISQSKEMTIKIAKLIKGKDFDSLAKLFGLTNRELMVDCFRLVGPLSGSNNVVLSCVADESEISTINGKHLILVRSKPGSHLVVMAGAQNRTRMSRNKYDKFHHQGEYYIDSFTFGRVGGKWLFTANGTGWMELHLN